MQTEFLQGFQIGELTVRPLTGQVTGNGRSSHLPPKAAEVLLCLVHRAGDVVDRQELLDEVWGKGHGTDEALNHAVAEIRHAFAECQANEHQLQTLPRRGYRLTVTPVPVGAAGSVTDQTDGLAQQANLLDQLRYRGVIETIVAYAVTGWLLIQVADVVFDQLLFPDWAAPFVTTLIIAGFPIAVLLSWFLEWKNGRAVLDTRAPGSPAARRVSRTYISIVGALAVASVAVFGYDRFIGLPERPVSMGTDSTLPAAPPVRESSIAVLPFLNIDGSDTTQIFARGLAEDLTNRLASVPGLAVASRGDSWSLLPSSKSADVRQRLRVAYYLEGSVRIIENGLRVVVQLIDSESGFHIVSRDFERNLGEYNDVQREITDLTVANLRVALPADTGPLLDSILVDTPVDAYVFYRRGRDAFLGVRSLESLDGAIEYYEQALAIDPRYAAAHAGICEALVTRYEFSGETADILAAESSCATALEGNARLYMVHTALGRLYRRTGRSEDAEQAFYRALNINPQDVDAIAGLARVYQRKQNYAEAEDLLEQAIEMQPGNWRAIDSLGVFFFQLGRYGDAVAAWREATFIEPGNGQVLGNLGSAQMMMGDFEAAAESLERAFDVLPDSGYLSNLGILYYYLGRFDMAVTTHREAVALNDSDPAPWSNLGDALNFAGDQAGTESAFERADQLAADRLAVDSTNAELLSIRAWANQMLGNDAQAAALIERCLSVAPDDPYSHYYKALIEIRRGNVDVAFDSLDHAVGLGYPSVMLTAEPYFEGIRGDERFLQLVASSE